MVIPLIYTYSGRHMESRCAGQQDDSIPRCTSHSWYPGCCVDNSGRPHHRRNSHVCPNFDGCDQPTHHRYICCCGHDSYKLKQLYQCCRKNPLTNNSNSLWPNQVAYPIYPMISVGIFQDFENLYRAQCKNVKNSNVHFLTNIRQYWYLWSE